MILQDLPPPQFTLIGFAAKDKKGLTQRGGKKLLCKNVKHSKKVHHLYFHCLCRPLLLRIISNKMPVNLFSRTAEQTNAVKKRSCCIFTKWQQRSASLVLNKAFVPPAFIVIVSKHHFVHLKWTSVFRSQNRNHSLMVFVQAKQFLCITAPISSVTFLQGCKIHIFFTGSAVECTKVSFWQIVGLLWGFRTRKILTYFSSVGHHSAKEKRNKGKHTHRNQDPAVLWRFTFLISCNAGCLK